MATKMVVAWEPCIMSNICYYYHRKIATLCSGVPIRSYRNNLQRNTLYDLTWQHKEFQFGNIFWNFSHTMKYFDPLLNKDFKDYLC